MSERTIRGHDGIHRAPRSETACPKGQTPDDAREVRLARAQIPLAPATTEERWLYLLALLTVLAPVPGSGWARLATGGGPLVLMGLPALAILALATWRAVQVIRDRGRLAAPALAGRIRWMRKIALAIMAVGVVVTMLQLLTVPIAGVIFKGARSETGVEFFVVGVWLAMFSGWGPVGLLLFEFSRMLGFERAQREQTP